MKAYKQTLSRIAWMRKNVRCETCRFWSDSVGRVQSHCANSKSWWSGEFSREDASCAQHWEPKEASDGR